MRMIKTMIAGGAGLAALAAAAPAAAQYGYANPYGYAQPYRYSQYGSQYAYGGVNTSVATQQCTAAVQNRLYNRTSIGGILGAVLGAKTTGRVLGVTRVTPSNGYRSGCAASPAAAAMPKQLRPLRRRRIRRARLWLSAGGGSVVQAATSTIAAMSATSTSTVANQPSDNR